MSMAQCSSSNRAGDDDSLVYTQGDLARMLKVTVRAVRAWECSGKLPPSIRLGNGRIKRWRKADIHEWLDGLA